MAKARRAKTRSRARGNALRRVVQKRLRDPWLWAALAFVALRAAAPYVWLGALLRELGLALALCAVVVAAVFAVRRDALRAALFAAASVYLAASSLAYWRSTRPTPEHGPLLRIAQAHAAGAQLSSTRLARFLAQDEVDVVSLTGLRESDARALLLPASGYVRVTAAGDASRQLWIKRVLEPEPQHNTLRVGRCQIELVQVDLPSLFAPSRLGERRRRITHLAQQGQEPRRVYVGHFGSASDAPDLAALRVQHEIRDARIGHGRLPSAPDLLGPLGLPLDHVLVHGWILARDAQTLAPLASGMHRTFVATLELTEPRCARKAPR